MPQRITIIRADLDSNATGKNKVYLIDLASGSNMNLLPLAIGLIGSYCMSDNEISEHYSIKYRYLRQHATTLIASLDNPFIVGFSCYVWNLNGSLAIAQQIKNAFPNCLIVLGGFSIPKRLERVEKFFDRLPFIDILVHGEGELVFAQLLKSLIQPDKTIRVDGVSYRCNNSALGFVSQPTSARICDLDTLESPFLNGVFDSMIVRYGESITGALWETNRGCPYSCTFCDWGNSDVNKIKKYSMERLYEEIKWISEKQFFYMFIADANFGIFNERDRQIAEWISEFSVKTGYPKHVVTNWPKNSSESVVAIAEILTKGGVACNITLAIQSTHRPTLNAVKRKNLAQEKLLKLKTLYHDRYIPTYVEVILGLPLETYESFRTGLDQILTYRIEDRFFVYLCQMLENSELDSDESRNKYSLETRRCKHSVSNRKFDWSDEFVEYEEFVVGTSTMPICDWEKSYMLGYTLTVLYNHRAAFFFMALIKQQFNAQITDFTEFLLHKVVTFKHKYPSLFHGLNHIAKQKSLILQNKSTMSGLPEADDLVVLPHVGALVLLVKNADHFFVELQELAAEYCAQKGYAIDPVVLEDVFCYQKARFPQWPVLDKTTHFFNTNIPFYFHQLTSGNQAPEIVKTPCSISVSDLNRNSDSFAVFASTLVRGGLTVDLLSVKINDQQSNNIETEYQSLRRQLEQNSLYKLKTEFEKVISNK